MGKDARGNAEEWQPGSAGSTAGAPTGREVLVSRRGAVALITLNRPHVRNALSRAAVAALDAALVQAQHEQDVRVIVITGAGTAFCSGDDMREAADLSGSGFTAAMRALQRLTQVLQQAGKPVIAAINGPALGAGLELTLACDLRISSARAMFGCPEASIGLVMTNGASMLLPQIVGAGRAAEMLLTGRVYSSDWALAAGLVNTVVPPETFWQTVFDLADLLACRSQVAIQLTRDLLRPSAEMVDAALCREVTAVTTARSNPDAQEGIEAFLARRPVRFMKGQASDE